MCGFVGKINYSESQEVQRADITSSLNFSKYRGPDNTSIIIRNNFGLGFNRLKIIDLDDRANQPMSDEKNQFTIVFNGEIYNYKFLRQELTKKKHQFYTESDTEVLLRLYIEYGKACLERDRFFRIPFKIMAGRYRLGSFQSGQKGK